MQRIYLLRMQADPMEQWRSLTTLYGEMGDLEIRELAANLGDLTEVAQQVLRDEIKKRGLNEKPSPSALIRGSDARDAETWDDLESDVEEGDADHGEASLGYTWKTVLCNSESADEAWIKCQMLHRAGIESWMERRGARHAIPWADELGVGDIQILVGADQLDEARAVIAQPAPTDIVEELKTYDGATEYVLPTCPMCGAEDPVLESADPVNSWECEACGHTWTDSNAEGSQASP
jgi:hypothetical protein